MGVWAHAQVDAGAPRRPKPPVDMRDGRRTGRKVGGRLEELERVVGESQRGHRNASK